tara:strand:+ start:39 stop:290 length:252 start_codon:yes stop_codon:yes gene_type:complete
MKLILENWSNYITEEEGESTIRDSSIEELAAEEERVQREINQFSGLEFKNVGDLMKAQRETLNPLILRLRDLKIEMIKRKYNL